MSVTREQVTAYYISPADPRRDNDASLTFHRAEAAAEAHGAGIAHDPALCGIPHPGTPEYAALAAARAGAHEH